jgi:hypothetical protein
MHSLVSCKKKCICRLEQEEQARQKLQLEKVSYDARIKKLEEVVAQHEDTNGKVIISDIGNFMLKYS